MQHLQISFVVAEADRVLCRQLVMILTFFFHWNEYSCYQVLL